MKSRVSQMMVVLALTVLALASGGSASADTGSNNSKPAMPAMLEGSIQVTCMPGGLICNGIDPAQSGSGPDIQCGGGPVNYAPPVLSGTNLPSNALNTTTGGWQDCVGVTITISFGWSGPHGSGSTYNVMSDDIGRGIYATVYASDIYGDNYANSNTIVIADPGGGGGGGGSGDTSPPSVPTSLFTPPGGPYAIQLSWVKSTDNVGVVGYRMWLNGAVVDTSPTNSYTFLNLKCGPVNYTLGVDAYDAAGLHSGVAVITSSTSVCPDTSPPSVPANLRVTNVSPTSGILNWDASTDEPGGSGLAGYTVLLNGGNSTDVPATDTSHTFNVACGTSNTLGVYARDKAGNRSATASTSFTALACPSPDPDGDGWCSPGFTGCPNPGVDNCPDVANNQSDLDADGIGDACDNDMPLVSSTDNSYMYDIASSTRDLQGGITNCSSGYRKKQIHLEHEFVMGIGGVNFYKVVTLYLDYKACYSHAHNRIEKTWDFYKDRSSTGSPWAWMGWESGTPQMQYSLNNSSFTVKLVGGVAICPPIFSIACGPTKSPWMKATFYANNSMGRSFGVS